MTAGRHRHPGWGAGRVLIGAALALILGAHAASADTPLAASPGGETVTVTGTLRTQCWQHGTRVLDVEGLEPLTIGVILRDHAMSFRRAGKPGIAVVLVPMGETLCMVTAPE